MFGTRGLYVSIVSALGGVPRFHKAEVMAQAATLLAAEEAERHRRVLVAIDEAHLLEPAQLEELRLLSNAEMDSASPFSLVLLGQPMLSRQLRLGVFSALDQGLALRYLIRRHGPGGIPGLPAPPPGGRRAERPRGVACVAPLPGAYRPPPPGLPGAGDPHSR